MKVHNTWVKTTQYIKVLSTWQLCNLLDYINIELEALIINTKYQ